MPANTLEPTVWDRTFGQMLAEQAEKERKKAPAPDPKLVKAWADQRARDYAAREQISQVPAAPDGFAHFQHESQMPPKYHELKRRCKARHDAEQWHLDDQSQEDRDKFADECDSMREYVATVLAAIGSRPVAPLNELKMRLHEFLHFTRSHEMQRYFVKLCKRRDVIEHMENTNAGPPEMGWRYDSRDGSESWIDSPRRMWLRRHTAMVRVYDHALGTTQGMRSRVTHKTASEWCEKMDAWIESHVEMFEQKLLKFDQYYARFPATPPYWPIQSMPIDDKLEIRPEFGDLILR